jgi:hypothetical protein
MPEELKPCPFCGGPVFIEEAPRLRSDNRRWFGVVCRNTMNLGGTCAIQQRVSATPEAAATRWNTRSLISTDPRRDLDTVALELAETFMALAKHRPDLMEVKALLAITLKQIDNLARDFQPVAGPEIVPDAIRVWIQL